MNETTGRDGGPHPAAWARWVDARVPLRVAAERAPACEAGPWGLDAWVEWVPVGNGELADLDGIYLVGPGRRGTAADPAPVEILQTRFRDLPLLDGRSAARIERRGAFLEAVFTRNRWRAFEREEGLLAEFHEAHDLLLRTRGEAGAAELAGIARSSTPSIAEYGRLLARHLVRPAPREGVLRILHLALATLRPRLAPRDRRTLRLAISDFGCGSLPLLAPRALLRYHAERGGDEGLAGQLFLDPYPTQLERPRAARSDGPNRAS